MNHRYTSIFLYKSFLLVCFILMQSFAFTQNADLIIQKTGPTSVKEGLSMSYTITISNNGPNTVTNATFNDTFPSGVSNVTLRNCTSTGGAICPTTANYSITTFSIFPNTYYNFKGTIPSLPVNSFITFIIDLNAPTYTNQSSFSNTASVKAPLGITDPDLSTNSSTWNTVLIDTIPVFTTQNYDIAVYKTVNDVNGYDCTQYPKSYIYKVKWVNNGPRDVIGVILVDNLKANITNLVGNLTYPVNISEIVWKSNLGSIPSTSNMDIDTLNLIINTIDTKFIKILKKAVPVVFKKGDTITYSFKFTINNPRSTCGANIKWELENEAHFYTGFLDTPPFEDTVPNNNSVKVISKFMTCVLPRTDFTNEGTSVKIIKTVDDTSSIINDSLPKTFNYTVKWINNGVNNVTNMNISDLMSSQIISSIGQGNTTFQYPWAISNVNWKISQGSSIIQITPFILSGTSIPGGYISTSKSEVPLLESGDTITLTYTFTLGKPIITGVGRNIIWNLKNYADYQYAGCNPNNGFAAIGKIIIYSFEFKKTDLKVTNSVDDIQNYSCQKETKIFNYKVQWVNGGPTDVNDVNISNGINPTQIYSTISYVWNINNIVWSSNNNTIILIDTFSSTSGVFRGPNFCTIFCPPLTNIQSNIPNFKTGDTIYLSYTLAIQPPKEIGCEGIIKWNLENRAYIYLPNNFYVTDTFLDNNYTYKINSFTEISTDLVISTAISPAIVDNGNILTITNEFYNAANAYAKPAIWYDTLPKTFNIDLSTISCSLINGNSSCGRITYDSTTRILKQEIDSMPANSGVKVTFDGTVNSLYTVTEYNKVYAYNSCLDCVPATNFTQSNYQINGQCDSVFAGIDGDTTVFENYRDTIFLLELLNGKPQIGGTWSQISGTVVFSMNQMPLLSLHKEQQQVHLCMFCLQMHLALLTLVL